MGLDLTFMLNKKDFENMRKEMKLFDNDREKVIAQSREIVRLSKKIIYAVHRKDLVKAKKDVVEIKKKIELIKKAGSGSELEYSGSIKIAVQEYVEAVAYYEYVKTGKIPSHKDLKLSPEHYLLGLCDLSGELVRNAINGVVKGDIDNALKIKDFVNELYWELSQFDFRNSELRRKYDSIKYGLEKLEDLALQLKLRK